MSTTANAAEDESPAELRPLLRMRLWRFMFLLLWVGSIPLTILAEAESAPVVVLIAAVGPMIFLFVWSIIASINAGRARPSNSHIGPPGIGKVVLAWLMLPLVVAVFVGAMIALGSVAASTVDQGGFSTSDLDLLALVVGGFFVIGVLVASYCPYGVLRSISRYVGGDSRLFRNWFVVPILASIGGFFAVVFAGLALGAGENGSGTNAIIASLVFVAALVLPPILWVIIGLRAMKDLEESFVRRQVKTASEMRGVVGGEGALTAAQQAAIVSHLGSA